LGKSSPKGEGQTVFPEQMWGILQEQETCLALGNTILSNVELASYYSVVGQLTCPIFLGAN